MNDAGSPTAESWACSPRPAAEMASPSAGTGDRLVPLSAMFAKDKSQEELRWEAYNKSSRGELMPSPLLGGHAEAAGALSIPVYLVGTMPGMVAAPLVLGYVPARQQLVLLPVPVILCDNTVRLLDREWPASRFVEEQQTPAQALPAPPALSPKVRHPFGSLPNPQQISFKDTRTKHSSNPQQKRFISSPLLVSKLRSMRCRRRASSFWDEEPPPSELSASSPQQAAESAVQQEIPPARGSEAADAQPEPAEPLAGASEPDPGLQAGDLQVEAAQDDLPQVTGPEYYVRPSMEELVAGERERPGYCRAVENFVVGRKDHGEIKFLGKTDVRGLDVCSIIRFNKNEVFVYMDESRKPPTGQGLNKPAQITLFNVRPRDNGGSGKFELMLREQAARQGSSFISYNVTTGAWKFLVDHFSAFGLLA